MGKRERKNKVYSAEFKIGVIMDMREHHLGYRETVRKYWDIAKGQEEDYKMDNGAMKNFFGRLKVEMFYGENFESVNIFVDELKKYIDYYNNERIVSKLKMSPVQYRTHSQVI